MCGIFQIGFSLVWFLGSFFSKVNYHDSGLFSSWRSINRDHEICCRLVDELINYNNWNNIISISIVAFLQLYINYKTLFNYCSVMLLLISQHIGTPNTRCSDISGFITLKQSHCHICVSSVVGFFSIPAVLCRASEQIFLHHLSLSIIKCCHLKWRLLFMYLGWAFWEVVLLSSCLALS